MPRKLGSGVRTKVLKDRLKMMGISNPDAYKTVMKAHREEQKSHATIRQRKR